MKSLIYVVAIGLAFAFLSSIFQWYIVVAIALALILAIAYSRRAAILGFLASQAYFVKGDEAKAYRLYQAAYKTTLMTSAGKVAFAAFCLYTDRFDRCERLLNEIENSSRSTQSDVGNAKHYRAILLWKQGNLDEAIEIMEEIHKEYTSTGTYGSLGVFYIDKAKIDGSFAERLEFMLEAYDYNESDKTIADNLGETYLNLKEYEKAKEVYSKLLETQQISPVPYYNYGRLLKAMGDNEGAKENFEKSLNCRFTRTLTITREVVEEELESL